MARQNAFGQPIGEDLPDWKPAALPPRTEIEGRYARVEPLDPTRHRAALYAAATEDARGSSWTYMGSGPFTSFAEYERWMEATCSGSDPFFYAITDLASGEALGMAAHLRIDPKVGSIEIGHIHYGPRLQRTRAATEAMFLLMRRAFDELGYRRYEWKCDALNAPSRRAATRLGFAYEGTFRQATIYKGRNRDTAWYAIIDRDWPRIAKAFEAWLAPDNFDPQGRQRRSLSGSELERP